MSLTSQPWLVDGLTHLIQSVKPGGAADAAGLTAGDKILQVDGVATGSMSHTEVASHLAGAAERRRTVTLLISSKGDAQQQLDYAVGDVVEVMAEGGQWVTATVAQINVTEASAVVAVSATGSEHKVPIKSIRRNDAALPPYWVPAYVGDGEKYYYNTVTNATSWEFPIETSNNADELASVAHDSAFAHL
jgi:hypothetical protein